MKLIMLTGRRGSGKSVFAETGRQMGISVYECSSVIFEMMEEKGIERTSENTGRFAEELRKERGRDIVAKLIYEKMRKDGAEIAILSGIRSKEEVEFLRRVALTVLIEVRASERARFERIMKRARPSDPKTWEAFLAREASEKRLGIEDVIAMADFIVENEGSESDFIEKSKRILAFLLKER